MLALTVLVALAIGNLPSQRQIEQERYAVYSAYITQGLTGESYSFRRADDLVLILDSTAESVERSPVNRIRMGLGTLFARSDRFQAVPWAHFLHLGLGRLFPHRLAPLFRIPAPYELISEEIAWSKDLYTRYPRSYGFLSFSPHCVRLNPNHRFLSVDHICGLGGGGEYVFMRKVDGRWLVESTYSTWIS